MPVLIAILWLMLFDLIFVGLFILGMIAVAAARPPAFAVLKRNFVGYFSNPTGYVFLCLFVMLTSIAAFWPNEFFTANLANLDQLNKFLPSILLIFIPAITMSIWAEERRQGTDELLLTLPATDFDIVIGKYLAAVAIYTCSLLFSQISSYTVLMSLTLGDLDTGMLFSTYFGYWLAGIAMIAIGMVASFLTKNLTVGFILGAAFNAPLAFLAYSDAIIPANFAFAVGRWRIPLPNLSQTMYDWSMAAQLDDFGRGILSFKSTIYFLMIAALGIYLSMVLIGRRHWSGGRDGTSMFGHYLVRAIAMIVIVAGATLFFSNWDRVRIDMTRGSSASLGGPTRKLIRELDAEHPIKIEAFVSAQVPEKYVQTKRDLITKLREFKNVSGAEIVVNIHDNLEPFSEEAALAEERFGITPQTVRTRNRGAIQDEEVILGAAFTCGLEKVVVPFFDYGVPVEYELTRSITTVAKKKRASVGVVRTDAQMFGGFSFAGGRPSQIPKQAIVDELEKQYDVEEVDPTSPIPPDKYDVLLIVQPSSLGPAELDNVVESVKNGQPAAIFEDPRPIFMGAPATGEPKQAPGGGMFGMGGGQRIPKGDIQKLWNVLGLEIPGETGFTGNYEPELAWQDYMPYLKLQIQGIPPLWVFASDDAPGTDDGGLNNVDRVTSGLTEVFFPVPGVIKPLRGSDLEFTKLVSTGQLAGTIKFRDYMSNQQGGLELRTALGRPKGEQIIAARISGLPKEAMQMAGQAPPAGSEDAATTGAPAADGKRPINVIYVADIDLMISTFLRIRARPDEDEEIDWRFENVTFLLNIIDDLSGDDAFIPIRKRKVRHSTLKMVEIRSSAARQGEELKRAEFQEKFDEAVKQAEAENTKALDKVREQVKKLEERRNAGEDVNDELVAVTDKLRFQTERLNRKLQVTRERLRRERDLNIKRIRRDVELQIRKMQNGYKIWAFLIPPIPLILVGLVVWVRRRLREREGISRRRLRWN